VSISHGLVRNECWVVHLPDFLRRLVALKHFPLNRGAIILAAHLPYAPASG